MSKATKNLLRLIESRDEMAESAGRADMVVVLRAYSARDVLDGQLHASAHGIDK